MRLTQALYFYNTKGTNAMWNDKYCSHFYPTENDRILKEEILNPVKPKKTIKGIFKCPKK